MTRRRHRTVGSLEREDLDTLVAPVAAKFIEMLRVITGRVVPPAMTPITAARTGGTRSYMRSLAMLWHLADREVYQLPLLSPTWLNHLIDEAVEPKIAVSGTPLTYLLDPHPEWDAAETVEEFQKGVFEYIMETAEKFGGYQRNWTDNPDAISVYNATKKYTVNELLGGASVQLPRIIGRLGEDQWKRWYQEGLEEGIEPDVEYLAQRAALHVQSLQGFFGSLMGIVRSGMMDDDTDPDALQDPELFRDALLHQLDEAITTIEGERPDDDPIRIAATRGANLRRVFEHAREEAGVTRERANRLASEVISASSEDQRNPALRWLPIEPDGATDLDLAQRSWLWLYNVSGTNLEADIWERITGSYDYPDWIIPAQD